MNDNDTEIIPRKRDLKVKKTLKSLALGALLVAVSFGSNVSAGDWTDNVKFKGDLRYRHEMIDVEDADARNRQRIRARFGLEAKVSDATKVGIQLATGSNDPVSTNQTLDDGLSTKNIRLDMAWFEMKFDGAQGLTLTGGKFKNPFFKPGKSELMWDSDLNPEGGVATFKRDFDNVSLTLIGAGLWIEERSSGDDSWMGAGQGVVKFNMNEKKSALAVGGGFFNYVNAQGYSTFYDDEDPFGNSVDTLGQYANDYELVEFFGEFSHKFENVPVVVMGDYVTNTAADSLDTGWLVGLRVGKVSDPGSWAFRYNYREVKADALLGIFTDSDFRGGGTDAKGHELGGQYQLAKNTTFNVSYFINEIGLEADETTGFNRLQVDLQLKFK